jgi:hypothetical protein
MLKLRNLFVLLTYVLGAHWLPFSHQLEHVSQLDFDVVDAKHPGDCQGHRHLPRLAARVPLASRASDNAQFVASEATVVDPCGASCATCLASKASCGLVALESLGRGDRLPVTLTKPIESTHFLFGIAGNLPGQRGPPQTSHLKLLLA